MPSDTHTTVRELVRLEGLSSVEELIEEYGDEASVPACCTEGCFVEPDGHCPHDCPSFMIALGVI